MRFTHPGFQLFDAPLLDAYQQGMMKKLAENARRHEMLHKLKWNPEDMPVALRWVTHPELGFPRQPFTLYRRQANYSGMPVNNLISSGSQAVVSRRDFAFSEEMYVLAVGFTVNPGQFLRLTPLGRGTIELRSNTHESTTSGIIILKAPFITGLRCEGMGSITQLSAVPMQNVLMASDWQPVQQVGLPFKTGEVAGQGYAGNPQGFLPGGLMNAKDAALVRLQLGEWLFTPPPPVSLADALVPDVKWVHPEPDRYLNMLFNGPDSQLSMIQECLEKCDDFSFDRNDRQPAFIRKTMVPGIHQPGISGSSTTAEADIPVVAQSMLSVSSESPAALALGYGTYDFVSPRMMFGTGREFTHMAAASNTSVNAQYFGYDYMVSGQFVIRPYGKIPIPFLDEVSKLVEFCALSDDRGGPVNPQQLEALGLQMNRPVSVDKPWSEAVKLRWKEPRISHGYAIVASYEPSHSVVINEPYDFNTDSHHSIYVPSNQQFSDQIDPSDSGKTVYVLPQEPVPLYGTSLHKYFVAGWDVFGRWSPWVRKLHTAVAPPPQQPGIMGVRLYLPLGQDTPGLSPSNPLVPATLEVDFSWDWNDRSPARIEIGGRFFNAGVSSPPSAHPVALALAAADTTTPVAIITFDHTDQDAVPVSSLGTVSLVVSNDPPGSGSPTPGALDDPSVNLRRYRLVISNVICTFTGSSPYEVAYAVYIRGLEFIRQPINEFSNWSGGFVSRLADPRPPAVTVLPATVQIASLPDATKISRGTLSWPAAYGALAYHIWEASETAVRVALDQKLKQDFPADTSKHLLPLTDSHVDRATQLRDLLAQPVYNDLCQKAFSRLTKEPVQGLKYQLELPGSSQVLHLYRVSSVNSANIESGRSNVVFFVVPRLAKPTRPILQVRTYRKNAPSDPEGEGMEVKVLQPLGELPLGYELYRIRKIITGSDSGMKGLPVMLSNAPGWSPATMAMPDGKQYHGKRILDLGITRSWKPLVYQAVAIGQPDPARALLRGESEASNTEIVYLPPATPPLALVTAMTKNSLASLFTISTNAPFDRVDLGTTLLELFRIDSQGNRTLLTRIPADSTNRITTMPVLAANASELAAWPLICHMPMDPVTALTVCYIGIEGSSVQVILRITDPLNRTSEIMLES